MAQNTIHLDLIKCDQFIHPSKHFSTRVIAAGSGPALILMHGGGGHAEAFSRNMEQLASKYRVYAIDLLWHGYSSKPAFREGNWLKQFTDHVLDFMDSMDIKKASFEGESLGGWIAIDLALHHKERVEKIILNTAWGCKFDPAYVEESSADLAALKTTSFDALNQPDKAKIRKRMEWLMAADKVTDEIIDVRYRIWTEPETNASLKTYYDHLFSPSTDEYLFDESAIRRIGVPTLILWTDNNPLHGLEAPKRLQELIAGSSCHIINDAAHWPQWEHPAEHDRVVLEFLG
jgi:2-hydroxy-6-oxonona-2,4-dienedioate hydrolase